jgi:acyl-homoserine lactone acylase PvdQ
VLNPEKGFYNTSNDYQIPLGWPHREALHYVWADPYRGQRVEEFLGSGRKFAVADMVQLQNSDLSIPARSLVPLLRGIEMPDAATQQAASRLLHPEMSIVLTIETCMRYGPGENIFRSFTLARKWSRWPKGFCC